MSDQFATFLEKLRTDPALREKIVEAEAHMAKQTMAVQKQIDDVVAANFDRIAQVASEFGIDLHGEPARAGSSPFRPSLGHIENPDCTLTCCLAATSHWRAPVRD